MKASDLFLKCLEEEGVEYIFGVPGEENADIMMSLLDSPIRFIITRHEQGAAFMADLYGRLTGKPGVCLATLGPGATNLITGYANAHFDNSPIVAITGQGSSLRLHKESHQNMDVVSMFHPCSKWNQSIRQPQNIPEVVRKAFKLAAREKPGGCHIELPEDIAKMDCDLSPIPVQNRKLRRSAADYKAIESALALLKGAKRPLFLAGNGCTRTRANRQLLDLVNATGIMVAHTFMGKGAVSARDHRSLGVAGLGSKDHVTEAFEKADLVMAIGYDLIEWPPERWNPKQDKKIIHLDFEPAEVDNHYRADVEVVADIADGLWQLNQRTSELPEYDLEDFAHIRDHILYEAGLEKLASKELVDADTDAADLAASDGFPMKPQRILRDLRSALHDADILVSDVGAHKMWVARHYPAFLPNTCIISNGFCSMGIAVPGAISAKLIRPKLRVVGLCGDGGFLMNVQELATAVQYKIPCTIMVWEDGGYGLIKWKQENQFGTHSHTDFTNPDLVALSRSFGAWATAVDSADRLASALEEAFDIQDRPSVIIVPVDYSENRKLTKRLGKLVAH